MNKAKKTAKKVAAKKARPAALPRKIKSVKTIAPLRGVKTQYNSSKLKEFYSILTKIKHHLDVDKNNLEEKSLRGSGKDASGDLSNFPIHLADAGSDTYEQDFSLEILEREDIELKDIDDAIERIENKTYGVCEECSKHINENRLKVIPYARFCINCQELLEKR